MTSGKHGTGASTATPYRRHDARVCIIGGGGTGMALAYDLALRGLSVVLFEQGELTSGTTGRHHGQLHSGARYAVGDRAIARECMEETLILRRIVPEAIEYNGGVFVAVDDEGAEYAPRFVAACNEAGIPAREVPVAEARGWEPAIHPGARRTVWVPDGSFDAFRVPLAFAAAARALGADIRPFTKVTGVEVAGGRARAVRVVPLTSGTGASSHRGTPGAEASGATAIGAVITRQPAMAGKAATASANRPGSAVAESGENDRAERIACDYIVSASGAWAAAVGRLAGVDVPVSPAPGTMVAVRGRVSDMILSRLAPPGDGDIIVPQRGLSIIGTTQTLTDSPDGILPDREAIAFLMRRADELAPGFSARQIHAVWAAARPLAGRTSGDGREISRDFMVLDHTGEGVAGMATLIGGKATVLRAMASKAADHVCEALGISEQCRTADFVLPSWRDWYGGSR